MQKILKDGDRIYATGVFLVKDSNTPSGWIVDGFEEDSYHDGKHVETEQLESGEIKYYIEIGER